MKKETNKMNTKNDIVAETSGEFPAHVKRWVENKNKKNDLDMFLILVFGSPDEKKEYCQKMLGDPDINYIEGKYYKIEVMEP